MEVESSISVMSHERSQATFDNILAKVIDLQEYVIVLEQEDNELSALRADLQRQVATLDKELQIIEDREREIARLEKEPLLIEIEHLMSSRRSKDLFLMQKEETVRDLRRQSEDMNKKLVSLMQEAAQGASTIKELDDEQKLLERKVEIALKKEKELIDRNAEIVRQHQEEYHQIALLVSSLQDELSSRVKQKAQADTKLLALDEFVAQLLGLNDALVSKLTGQHHAHRDHELREPEKQRQRSIDILSRAAALTATTSRDDVCEIVHQLQSIRIRPSESIQLIELHEMYIKLARSMKELVTSPLDQLHESEEAVNKDLQSPMRRSTHEEDVRKYGLGGNELDVSALSSSSGSKGKRAGRESPRSKSRLPTPSMSHSRAISATASGTATPDAKSPT